MKVNAFSYQEKRNQSKIRQHDSETYHAQNTGPPNIDVSSGVRIKTHHAQNTPPPYIDVSCGIRNKTHHT